MRVQMNVQPRHDEYACALAFIRCRVRDVCARGVDVCTLAARIAVEAKGNTDIRMVSIWSPSGDTGAVASAKAAGSCCDISSISSSNRYRRRCQRQGLGYLL